MRTNQTTFSHTFHEIGRDGGMSLTVDLSGSLYEGCAATYWEPAEGPEFDAVSAVLVEVINSDGDDITDWAVERGWADSLTELAIELANDPANIDSVLESACDEAAATMEWLQEEAAERRRDRLRG